MTLPDFRSTGFRPDGSDMNRVAKQLSVAEVRSALVFSRSAALAEYGGFPDLHYYIMEGRHPSALELLSDGDTRLAVGDSLVNLASECDRSSEPAKRFAGRKLRTSRIGLLDAFAPALTPARNRLVPEVTAAARKT